MFTIKGRSHYVKSEKEKRDLSELDRDFDENRFTDNGKEVVLCDICMKESKHLLVYNRYKRRAINQNKRTEKIGCEISKSHRKTYKQRVNSFEHKKCIL